MKAEDFQALSLEELNARIEDMHKDLFNMRMQLHSNQLTNTNKIRTTKQDIARAMTIKRQKEMQISEAGN